jgi:acetyltransferase-like isoleucine patch superfamily enzyme
LKKRFLRRGVKKIAVAAKPLMMFTLMLFFDRKYLKGRHFDEELAGYIWGFRSIWTRNILRLATPCKFPADHRVTISNSTNIDFHPDDLNSFQSPGSYFQNFAGSIRLGRGTYVAPNVGIITSNHDLEDLDKHAQAIDVIVGEGCWIGMNAVLLPGVVLGPRTIVGAGAVVTKSFTDGHCVIAGNPARVIKVLKIGEPRL